MPRVRRVLWKGCGRVCCTVTRNCMIYVQYHTVRCCMVYSVCSGAKYMSCVERSIVSSHDGFGLNGADMSSNTLPAILKLNECLGLPACSCSVASHEIPQIAKLMANLNSKIIIFQGQFFIFSAFFNETLKKRLAIYVSIRNTRTQPSRS